MACDHLVESHDMQVYWKKVRGHSRVPGPDKDLNDQADTLAKQGAVNGEPWQFRRDSFPDPPTHFVHAVTRSQAARTPPSAPAFSDADLVSLQASDPAIHRMLLCLSDPTTHAVSSEDLDSVPYLRPLYNDRPSLATERSSSQISKHMCHISFTACFDCRPA